MDGITVIVVGAGNFGRHYSKIILGLNETNRGELPLISTLVVTKTRKNAADEMAHRLSRLTPNKTINVVPEKVASATDLSAVLDRHAPMLTCITARDKTVGDAVHADYSQIALEYGRVLCEKPFSSATGDGASLNRLKTLLRHENAKGFGLELPLAIALKKLLIIPTIAELFYTAHRLSFVWGAQGGSKPALIDDLALHPWSLIPRYFKPMSLSASETTPRANVAGCLRNERTGRDVALSISLHTATRFRGLQLDNMTLFFQIKGTNLNIIELPMSLEKAITREESSLSGKLILTIENPLRQHIIATLTGAPLVDLKQTYESQLFLEMAHGYEP